jgi:hypothetical protein
MMLAVATTQPSPSDTMVALALGAAFVFLHSFVRFNRQSDQPTPAWASTTKVRYVGGAIAYSSFIILIYWAITRIPNMLPTSLVAGWPDAFQQPPLLAALLLTVLLPQIGVLKDWDSGIRDFFHRRASIPGAMRALSAQLQTGRDYEVPVEMRDRVVEYLDSRDFRPSDVRFDDDGKLRYLFTRITVLYLQVEQWESDPIFSSFVASDETEFQLLQSRYNALCSDIRTVLRMRKPERGSTAEKLVDEVLQRTKDFLRELCDFVSRAVLQSGWRQPTREAQLHRLGFGAAQPMPPGAVSTDFWNDLISLLGSLLLLLFVSFVLISRIPTTDLQTPTLKEVLVLTFLAAATQFFAVLCATVPRRWMVFSRAKPEGLPVALIYVIIAHVSFAIAALLSLGAGAIMQPAPRYFPKLLGRACSWAVLAPATTLATAYNIDHSGKRSRWVEGIINVVALWVGMFVVCVLTSENNKVEIVEQFAATGAVGFLIGAWIPRRFRKQSAAHPAAIGADPTAASPAATLLTPAPAVPLVPAAQATAALTRNSNLRPLMIDWGGDTDFVASEAG